MKRKRNRKYSQHLTHEGHTAPLQYWADNIGITYQALKQRLVNGWTVADAVRTPRFSPRLSTMRKPVAPVMTPFEELKNQQLAIQRHFNSILRQFNRDLHAIMGRSLDRGVVADISKNANDRSIPIARDRV
jgi:hypothetical protein